MFIAPKEVPENTSAVPLDSKSVKINWLLKESHENAFIDGFYIGYRIAGSSEPFTFNTMHIANSGSENEANTRIKSEINDDDDDVSRNHNGRDDSRGGSVDSLKNTQNKHYYYIVRSLRKSTKYAFMIQAFNKEGEGPYSDQIFTQTFANGKRV